MKKLKITICAMLLLFSGVVFAACGNTDNRISFDAAKFNVGNVEYFYDGDDHIFSVTYENLDLDVKYSLDGETFKTGEELNLTDAGTYKVYYKVSSDGYKDYVSNAVDFIIHKLNVTVAVEDYYHVKSSQSSVDNIEYQVRVDGADILNYDLEFDFIVDGYNVDTAALGNEYTVSVREDTKSALNTNINYTFVDGKLYLTDAVEVIVSDNIVGYYSNLATAVADAPAGATIKLNSNVTLDSMVNVDKVLTIDGQGKYTISANTGFTGAVVDRYTVSMFNIGLNSASTVLELKDVTLDCNGLTRAVSAFSGTVKINGATIKEGNNVDDRRAGGVYIRNAANFIMTDGEITGSEAPVIDYADVYATDLWLGSNANGSLASINGGKVGSVFVNANSYSANNPGSFTLNGGVIDNLYVEYSEGYGATFNLVQGNVTNLYISTQVSGEAFKVGALPGRQYKGGMVAIVANPHNDNIVMYDNLDSVSAKEEDFVTVYVDSVANLLAAYEIADHIVIVKDILNDGNNYVGDITLTADERDYKFTIDLNGHKVDAELDFINHHRSANSYFYDHSIDVAIIDSSENNTATLGSNLAYTAVYIRGDENVKVTLNAVKCTGYASGIYVNGYSEGAIINANNCVFNGVEQDDNSGAYLAGNGTYTFFNCDFSGDTAYYTKSGIHTLVDCDLVATQAEYVAPQHYGDGFYTTGSAIIIDSATGYSQVPPLTVTIDGGSMTSESGYGIEEISTAKAGETKVHYSTINIVEEPTYDTAKDNKYSENGLFD